MKLLTNENLVCSNNLCIKRGRLSHSSVCVFLCMSNSCPSGSTQCSLVRKHVTSRICVHFCQLHGEALNSTGVVKEG